MWGGTVTPTYPSKGSSQAYFSSHVSKDSRMIFRLFPLFFHSWSINNTLNKCRREAQWEPVRGHVAGQHPEVRESPLWGQAPSTPRAWLHSVANRLRRVYGTPTRSLSSKRKVSIPKWQEGFWNDPMQTFWFKMFSKLISFNIWNGVGGRGLALFCFLPSYEISSSRRHLMRWGQVHN